MKRSHLALVTALTALCACSRSEPQPTPADNGANLTEPPTPSAPPAAPLTPPAPQKLAPLPAPAPVQAPAIDPKSSEAAEAIVRSFVGLLNHRRFDEAYMLLGAGAPKRSDFDARFAAYSDLDAKMGTPGAQEGAAGSIYLSIPIEVTGRKNGISVDRHMTAVLRRVNDVPGSTDAQRHWHIERIDTQPA